MMTAHSDQPQEQPSIEQMDVILERLRDELRFQSEQPHGICATVRLDDLSATLDLIEDLTQQLADLKRENERAWTERNTAYAKVKGWEAAVYVEGLPLRAVPIDEWGPGEGGQTTVPEVTPKRLVDLLNELTRLRAMKGQSK